MESDRRYQAVPNAGRMRVNHNGDGIDPHSCGYRALAVLVHHREKE
jgi:hypothetical protein